MNYLIEYSIKNLTRNKRRTLLTLFAIGFAVFFMILGNSYFSGIVSDLIQTAVRENGHIILQKKSYTKKERLAPLDESINNPKEIIDELMKDKIVSLASERIFFGGFFIKNDESIASFGQAFSIENEKDTVKLQNHIIEGSYFTREGKEIIIGVEIAKVLGVKKQGEIVTLLTRDINGSFSGGKFKVSAIIDMGTKMGNKVFYIPLSNAYKMLKNTDSPQKIVIYLKDYNKIKKYKSALMKNPLIINNELDVLSVNEIGVFKSVFSILKFLIPIIFSFFAIIALLTIINTMMMTVLERTGEIGVLQALGIKRGLVAATFIFESLTIGIIGSIIGGIISSAVVFIFSIKGIHIGSHVANGMPIAMKSVIYPEFSLKLIFQIIILGIFISFLAGIIPALKALKLNPAKAIRE